ncbi:hypothetical protein [Sigmofec virus UA08Rod_7382]|uniref:Uncharacterized protein n=1 Tax=Sigmofec virus UA08Rod_7382 TaxID=2929246 RepID=A0A976N0H0_9VIRU|nr:hypothetical protein [Sigmofec virus UA08Rod_7382]
MTNYFYKVYKDNECISFGSIEQWNELKFLQDFFELHEDYKDFDLTILKEFICDCCDSCNFRSCFYTFLFRSKSQPAVEVK